MSTKRKVCWFLLGLVIIVVAAHAGFVFWYLWTGKEVLALWRELRHRVYLWRIEIRSL